MKTTQAVKLEEQIRRILGQAETEDKMVEMILSLLTTPTDEIKREAFVYHYWCYNPTTGITIYPDSVELDVVAENEEMALEIAKKMVRDRGIYKLQTVNNLTQQSLDEGDKDEK